MVPEYQAIIMAAGKGTRMMEITSRKPKCLLPVCNQPVIYYSLRILENAGFHEVIVVALENARSEIEFEIEKMCLKLRVNVLTIPSDSDWGTMDSLHFISQYLLSVLDVRTQDLSFDENVVKRFLEITIILLFFTTDVKTDFVVMSCDVVSTVDINDLLSMHRKHEATVTNLYFDTPPASPIVVPGLKSSSKPERDLVGIDSSTNRLVFCCSASDFDETLPFSGSLLRKHGYITLHTRLLDAHVFVMKRWLLDYQKENHSMNSIKGEFIPFIVKKQASSKNKLDLEFDKDEEEQQISSPTLSKNQPQKNDIYALSREDNLTLTARSMSSYNDHVGDSDVAYNGDSIRCYALIAPRTQFAARCNTIRDYIRANKEVTSNYASYSNSYLEKISDSSNIESTQLDKEKCFIEDGTNIAQKTSVQCSSIRNFCNVHQKTRVADSIIMNRVTIEEGCVIQNCIICDDARVEKGCTLKDCIVGSLHTVPANSSHTNEVLTDPDRLMEI